MPNARSLLTVVLTAVSAGALIGGLLFVWSSQAPQDVAQAVTVTPPVTARPPTADTRLWTPIPRGSVGQIGHLGTDTKYGHSLVWVEELGLSAWDRAYDNRDDKGMSRVMDVFETLRVPDGALVKVIVRRPNAIQVEVLGGNLAGRRGWTYVSTFVPTS